MVKKKITAILMAIGTMLCITACGSETKLPEKQWHSGNDKGTEVVTKEGGETENTSEASSQIEQTTEVTIEATMESTTETAQSDVAESSKEEQKIQLLQLEKAFQIRYEWDSDTRLLMLQSEYSHILLSQESAVQYPEMAQTLDQLAAMRTRAMETEIDDLIWIAQGAISDDPEGFETYVSTMDLYVRRADSQVLSLLVDTYADYGRIDGVRSLQGCNYDTQTGQELKLSDVIIDMNELPEIIEREVNGHMWNGEFYSDTVVEDYFRDTPEDGISWTLDYNGVTFYFSPGTLCPAGFGSQTATVSFAEFPEMFAEQYRQVPEAYTVRLAMNNSFFTDLDGNGVQDELLIAGNHDEDGDFYWDFGIYTDVDGYYYYQEHFAHDFVPYYVKTAEGKSYLYLFCEELSDYDRQMDLVVVALNVADFTKVIEQNMGPEYLPENRFIVPTDPAVMYLDDRDSDSYGEVYAVGEDGAPVKVEGISGQ